MVGLSTDTFITAVTLLIRSSKNEDVTDMVNQLLELYVEEKKLHPEIDTPINNSFIELLTKLKSIPRTDEGKVEKSALIVNFLTDPAIKRDELVNSSLKEVFEEAQRSESDDNTLLKKKLNNSLLWVKYSKAAKRMFSKLTACQSTLDEEKQEQYLNDAINTAMNVVELAKSSDRLMGGAVERIDFGNAESIQKSLNLYRSRQVKGILKTGLQGLNMMLGSRGGFALGESVCMYALMHNFKSGMLMTIARNIARYNNPEVLKVPGKPLILFISLENEAYQNLFELYQTAYEQSTHESAEGKTDDFIIQFVQSYFTESGWHFIMERRNGAKFGYEDYVALIESYKAQGYTVVAVFLDYMAKMKNLSSGFGTKNTYQGLGELCANLVDYNKSSGILFVTAHQLARNALAENKNKHNMVKYFNVDNIADCIQVSREMDMEMYLNIEKTATKAYLTVKRGKHRYMKNTPIAHQYFAYPFTEYGIEDDINGEPKFVRDIYDDENDNGSDIGSDDIF